MKIAVIGAVADDAVACLVINREILIYIFFGFIGGIRRQIEFAVVEKEPQPVEWIILRTAKIYYTKTISVNRIRRNKAVPPCSDSPFGSILRIFRTVKTQAKVIIWPACPECGRSDYPYSSVVDFFVHTAPLRVLSYALLIVYSSGSTISKYLTQLHLRSGMWML